MELIVNFQRNYNEFLNTHKSEGFCMGFCLTWLGDILKNRPVKTEKNLLERWVPGWFSSAPSVMHVHIPVDRQEFIHFLERAARRQKNYETRVGINGTNSSNARVRSAEFTAHYKNNRQRELEKNSENPGLEYSYSKSGGFSLFQGLKYFGKSCGVIFGVSAPQFKNTMHAVALVRISSGEYYFLDPNYDLFRVNGQFIRMDINTTLQRHYPGYEIFEQIVISQK